MLNAFLRTMCVIANRNYNGSASFTQIQDFFQIETG
jgi:hypothetical protein